MPVAYLLKDATFPNDRFMNAVGTGYRLDMKYPYIVVVLHPDTTPFADHDHQKDTLEVLKAVQVSNVQAIWMYPNIDVGSDAISKCLRQFRNTHSAKIRFFNNFPPEIFAGLLKKASCMVGNSSAGIRQTPFLGVPSINIGDRQNGRESDRTFTRHVNAKSGEISAALECCLSEHLIAQSFLYGHGNSGPIIANYIKEAL